MMEGRMRRSVIELDEKEKEAERRLNYEVNVQKECDKRLSIVLNEEETLSSNERIFNVEPEAQSTPKRKREFSTSDRRGA